MRGLLIGLALLLALPVLGVLGAWVAVDAQSMAVLQQQLAKGHARFDGSAGNASVAPIPSRPA